MTPTPTNDDPTPRNPDQPRTPRDLNEQLDDIELQLVGLTGAVRHAASRRAFLALIVSLTGMLALLVWSNVERSISRHTDCVRGNETRASIDLLGQQRSAAMGHNLAIVATEGQGPEARARALQRAEALRLAVEADPTIVAARA